MSKNPANLTESDLAMIDAVRVVYDLLLGAQVLNAVALDDLLATRQKGWEQQGKHHTAAVLAMLRSLSTDQDARKHREGQLALRAVPPKGWA